jgi:circadian clock protein KaiC
MVMTMESINILGASMELPTSDLSSLLEGLIIMRYAELEGRIQRLLSITKQRDSGFDPCLRRYEITARGIEVGAAFSGVEGLMSGFAHEPGK